MIITIIYESVIGGILDNQYFKERTKGGWANNLLFLKMLKGDIMSPGIF